MTSVLEQALYEHQNGETVVLEDWPYNISWNGFNLHSADKKSINEVKRLTSVDSMNEALHARLQLMVKREALLQNRWFEVHELIRKVSSEPHLWSTLSILEELEGIMSDPPRSPAS